MWGIEEGVVCNELASRGVAYRIRVGDKRVRPLYWLDATKRVSRGGLREGQGEGQGQG